jgi:hypothetical protein
MRVFEKSLLRRIVRHKKKEDGGNSRVQKIT